MLARQIDHLLAGTAKETPQDESQVTYFGGRKPEDGRIHWTQTSTQIFNLIRAVTDPYHLLPSVTPGVSAEQLEHGEEFNEKLANGGAAMMAYARLQFMHIPDSDRRALESALLRYCELDTMAMVLIWEHWMNLLRQG